MPFVASLQNCPSLKNKTLKQLKLCWCQHATSWIKLIMLGKFKSDDKGEAPAKQAWIGDDLLFPRSCRKAWNSFPAWKLVELPRSFLRPPLILSLVLQRDFLCGKCQCLSFKSQKKKVKKEDLQKQVPCCPFAHSCRKKSQELLMNVPAVCGKSAKLSLWAFVSLLRSLF